MVEKDGTIVAFVHEEDEAWAQGRVDKPTAAVVRERPTVNPNAYCIAIEHEGDGTHELTELQRASSIALIREICGAMEDPDRPPPHHRPSRDLFAQDVPGRDRRRSTRPGSRRSEYAGDVLEHRAARRLLAVARRLSRRHAVHQRRRLVVRAREVASRRREGGHATLTDAGASMNLNPIAAAGKRLAKWLLPHILDEVQKEVERKAAP
jgi:hypothetical protein